MLFAECPDYYLGKPFVVDYVACVDCGLIQQTPLPQDILPFYEEYPVHEARSGLLDRASRLLMHQVYHNTSADPAGSAILDYGCGSGAYLDSLKGKGFELSGYELDALHAESLSSRLGVPVYSDVDSLIRDRGGRIDVLTMHFVLEHVTDLDATFAHVSQLLKPGGTCHIVVPNASSWECRLFGKKWHGLDPPRHVSFPDPFVVDSQARRHGMRLARTRSVAFPNGVAGSIPVVILGRFSYRFFLACVPIGLVVSRLAPSGCAAFWLVRDA
jgi:2-polyprenyl-3-methyl-5-hydroxy-6-metoxy-1,4-benzoquinol methylase